MLIYRLIDLSSGDEIGLFHFYEMAVQSVVMAHPDEAIERSAGYVWYVRDGIRSDFAIEELKVRDRPYDFNWISHIGKKGEPRKYPKIRIYARWFSASRGSHWAYVGSTTRFASKDEAIADFARTSGCSARYRAEFASTHGYHIED